MPFATNTSYPFTEAGIATYAPRRAGVYGICNSLKWIYIGESEDMEARLYAHLRGESDQSGCILRNGPTSYVFEICDGVTARLAREAALIRELHPSCNY
jgi:predicted GIY-YIG superfamily endonuclease